MNAAAKRRVVRRVVPPRWVDVHEAAPQVALTMLAYVEQMRVSCRPSTVKSLETDLFTFATFVIRHDKKLCCVAEIGRAHVEAFKVWQAARPGVKGGPIASATLRRRLGMVRMFFIRIIEWGWNDAPSRVPLYFGDVPKRDESLPKFLDDGDYVKFMRALDQEPVLRRRLSVELLARTGMRVGELCALDAHALTTIAGHPWLRIPVGKLHNDRFVPLHPHLVELINEYQTKYGPHDHGFLISGEQGVLNRYAIARWVSTIARRAGIGHVHPHKLRHTLATQAINRGMSLDAIAALLGHRSLDMTMRYARISNRVVQDEYNAVSA